MPETDMKTGQDFKNKKVPFVTIDPALHEYRDEVIFPGKLEQANKVLKTAKLPPTRHNR